MALSNSFLLCSPVGRQPHNPNLSRTPVAPTIFSPVHICLQTQGRQLERSLCRLVMYADGNKYRKRLLLYISVKQFERDAAQRRRYEEM